MSHPLAASWQGFALARMFVGIVVISLMGYLIRKYHAANEDSDCRQHLKRPRRLDPQFLQTPVRLDCGADLRSLRLDIGLLPHFRRSTLTARETWREPRGTVAAAAFDTAIQKTGWFPSGSAAKGEAGFLRGMGYRLIAEPEQFLVKGIDGPLLDGELERAKAWGVLLAASAG